LQITLISLYIGWAIGVAARSATSMTSEHERKTWGSLIATPLGAWDIVAGKMVGAIWSLRWMGAVWAVCLALGIAAGAIHPLGGICSILTLALFLIVVAALGTTMSLLSASSIRSVAVTVTAILAFNGNLLVCCFGAPLEPMLLGITPAIQWLCLSARNEFRWSMSVQDLLLATEGEPVVATMLVAILFYGLAAVGLTAFSLTRFKVIADRPRLPVRQKGIGRKTGRARARPESQSQG
jgi:hypothetical protein